MAVERVCIHCKKSYIAERRDRKLKFCSRKCVMKVHRYAPKDFWINATFAEKQNRLKKYLLKHATITDGCWLWDGYLSDGYGLLSMGKLGLIGAHRASWMIYKGPIPDDLIVLHNCDNRSCTNPNHLRLGTHKDNSDDKYKRKRDNHARGERHPSAIINTDIVFKIRELIKQGKSTRYIKDLLNISGGIIDNIKYDKTWRSV